MDPCVHVTWPAGQGWICSIVILLQLWPCHPSCAPSPQVIAQSLAYPKHEGGILRFSAHTWGWDQEDSKLLQEDHKFWCVYYGSVYVDITCILIGSYQLTVQVICSAWPCPKDEPYTQVLGGGCVWWCNGTCWSARTPSLSQLDLTLLIFCSIRSDTWNLMVPSLWSLSSPLKTL